MTHPRTDAVDRRTGRGPPWWRVTFGDGFVVEIEAASSGAARAKAQDKRWPDGLPILTDGCGRYLKDVQVAFAIKEVEKVEP